MMTNRYAINRAMSLLLCLALACTSHTAAASKASSVQRHHKLLSALLKASVPCEQKLRRYGKAALPHKSCQRFLRGFKKAFGSRKKARAQQIALFSAMHDHGACKKRCQQQQQKLDDMLTKVIYVVDYADFF